MRETRAAIERRAHDADLVRKAQCAASRNEFKDDVTALLLSFGVALNDPEMSQAALQRFRKIEEIATNIRGKLVIGRRVKGRR